MKTMITGLAVATAALVFAGSSFACQGEHGYKKTAQLLEQSTITSVKKAALMQIIADSKADHDKFTAIGDYSKMNDAVDELAEVKSQIAK